MSSMILLMIGGFGLNDGCVGGAMGLQRWQQVEHIDQLKPGMAVQTRQRYAFYSTFTTGTIREVRYWHQSYIESTPCPGGRVYVAEATIIVEDQRGEVIIPRLDECYVCA